MGGFGSGVQSTSTTALDDRSAPVAEPSEPAENPDPLTSLEQRWDALAGMIRNLRSENGALREQLKEREERITRNDEETARLKEQLDGLTEEKKKTIARIEGLLARFDDIGQ